MAVTLPGGSGTTITVSSGSNNLGSAIGNALSNLGSAVAMTTVTVGSSVPNPPALGDGQSVSELLLTGSASVNATIPSGYTYVAALGSTAATLSGSNVNI